MDDIQESYFMHTSVLLALLLMHKQTVHVRSWRHDPYNMVSLQKCILSLEAIWVVRVCVFNHSRPVKWQNNKTFNNFNTPMYYEHHLHMRVPLWQRTHFSANCVLTAYNHLFFNSNA